MDSTDSSDNLETGLPDTTGPFGHLIEEYTNSEEVTEVVGLFESLIEKKTDEAKNLCESFGERPSVTTFLVEFEAIQQQIREAKSKCRWIQPRELDRTQMDHVVPQVFEKVQEALLKRYVAAQKRTVRSLKKQFQDDENVVPAWPEDFHELARVRDGLINILKMAEVIDA